MIVTSPNVPHMETSRDGSPLEYIVFGIEGLQFTSLTNHMEYEDYSVHNYYEFEYEILLYLKTLVQEITQRDNDYKAAYQNLLEVLIISVVRRTRANLIIAPSQKITKECHFVEQCINNHYQEDIMLELLSEGTHMNKFYLIHAPEQYKGIPPINCLIRLHIRQTKGLLETTNYFIAQIFDSCDFSSQSYSSWVFKKAYGMTPNVYRKSSDRDKVIANDITQPPMR